MHLNWRDPQSHGAETDQSYHCSLRAPYNFPQICTSKLELVTIQIASKPHHFFVLPTASSDPPVASPLEYECAPMPARLPFVTIWYSCLISLPAMWFSKISRTPAAYRACAEREVPEMCGVIP